MGNSWTLVYRECIASGCKYVFVAMESARVYEGCMGNSWTLVYRECIASGCKYMSVAMQLAGCIEGV